MNLSELAYFTDNVKQMADFYRALLGIEPVAQSDDMAIFMSGKPKYSSIVIILPPKVTCP